MRKTRIQVQANIVARADVRKAAKLAADDWNDEPNNMVDNDDKADIDSANVDPVEFGVHNNILLVDSVRETRRKQAVEDYTNTSEINVITSIIINLGAENANHMEDSLYICRCQVAEYYCPNRGDIENIEEYIVALWQKIICQGSQVVEEEMSGDII